MRSRLILIAAATLLATTVAVRLSAQGGPPQGGAPAQGGRGGAPAPPRGGGGGGGGRATFPAQQRPAGDPALIARGNGLYGVNCRLCHGADLRGGDGGPNLLRSQLVLNDQAGELIGPVVMMGRQGAIGTMPPFPLPPEDVRALAEYIHSVTASMRGQGNPPLGEVPALNVLVGDAAAGQTYFTANCASCHVSGPATNLTGIGSKITDPTQLQNYWLSAGNGLGRGGRGGAAPAPGPATRQVTVRVSPATGPDIEGVLVRLDDFYIVLRLADDREVSFRRNGEIPSFVINDPFQGHKNLLPKYTDRDIHNVTAYLVTLK